jgi:hypothetical protein
VDEGAPIEVSVDDLIEELFESAEDGPEKRKLLEGYGYWGCVQIWRCIIPSAHPPNCFQ